MTAKKPSRLALLALCCAGACLVAREARADVSSWVGMGFGPSSLTTDGSNSVVPSLRFETGMGSSPRAPMAVGGLLGFQAHFGHSADLSLSLRSATRGYVDGGWGIAMDIGGYHRFGEVSNGVLGSLTLGAPWGLTLAGGASAGLGGARSVYTLIGFDFARLTVYRRTGGRWWPNPQPGFHVAR